MLKTLLGCFFSAIVLVVALSPGARSLYLLPVDLRVTEGSSVLLPLHLPFSLGVSLEQAGMVRINGTELGPQLVKFCLSRPLSLETLQQGTAQLRLSVFGLTIRRLKIEIVPVVELVPAGHSVGVSLRSDGLMVVGFANIQGRDAEFSPAREAGIRLGDRILSAHGMERPDSLVLNQITEELGRQRQQVLLTVGRDDRAVDILVTPHLCSETGQHRLGLFVRDNVVGVGTLTFVDRESNIYGALGHVIADIDTGRPVEVGSGNIVRATVTSIESGKRGAPGEKRSVFVKEENNVGSITKNSEFGIFGEIHNDLTGDSPAVPILLRDQVREGPAYIYTVIDGEKVERFAIEVQRVSRQQSAPGAKGLVVKVTDERLLAKTGGIVQGMSGSPILQGGKLVGAVTHVFVNDPSRGYGMFIEWMVGESGLLERREEIAPTFFYRQRLRAS